MSAVFQHCLPSQHYLPARSREIPHPTLSSIPATALAAPLPPSSIPRPCVKGRGSQRARRVLSPLSPSVHRLPGLKEPWLCVVFSPRVTWNTSAKPSKVAGMRSVRTWFILHTAWVAARGEFGHLHTAAETFRFPLHFIQSEGAAQPEFPSRGNGWSQPSSGGPGAPSFPCLHREAPRRETAPSQAEGWLFGFIKPSLPCRDQRNNWELASVHFSSWCPLSSREHPLLSPNTDNFTWMPGRLLLQAKLGQSCCPGIRLELGIHRAGKHHIPDPVLRQDQGTARGSTRNRIEPSPPLLRRKQELGNEGIGSALGLLPGNWIFFGSCRVRSASSREGRCSSRAGRWLCPLPVLCHWAERSL